MQTKIQITLSIVKAQQKKTIIIAMSIKCGSSILLLHNIFHIIITIMFQNSYQNGTYFDVFDPKAPADKVKSLYKLTGVHGNNKIFDKDLKTYVFQFIAPNSKMHFPKQQRKDLYLIQPYLTFQILFYPGTLWNIELTVSDLQKTKRRIILSPATNKIEKKPFFVKYPCLLIKQGVWMNFTVDLYSFINAFKGQTYRSLDEIQISGQFKLRRVFTSQAPPVDNSETEEQMKPISFLPKNYYFPPGYQVFTSLINYEEEYLENLYEPTQTSTKNGSLVEKKKKQNLDTSVKSYKKIGYKNEKKFLANTNGPDTMPRKAKKQTDAQSEFSQSTIKPASKTPAATEKNISKRKALGKTHTTKARSSLDKKKLVDESPDKAKALKKLNPWRSNKRDIQTDGGQMTSTKITNQRKIQSAQTTLFKTKNNLAAKIKFNESKNAGFDRRSDQCSDSEYFQLSQKFSTLTDGKFFKNQLGSQYIKEAHINGNEEEQDEIQQNIEMETNSVHSQTKKQARQTKDIINNLKSNLIDESICDSLQNYEKEEKSQKKAHQMFMSSHYGFGEKIMNKFMHDVERPYSPPLGDREHTEQGTELGNNDDGEKEMQLIYDPVLNCYYDHKTHTYYQLK